MTSTTDTPDRGAGGSKIPTLDEWADLVWDEATLRDTILIVESHDQLRAAFAESLAEEFYRVLESSSGEDALRIAREHQPHLILLDLALEDLPGLEVAARLRSHPATRSIPLVALTAHHAQQMEAGSAGIAPVLLMPVALAELIATIDRVLDAPHVAPGHRGGLAPEQLRLELRDGIRSEHLTLGSYFPLRVRFEALGLNQRYIHQFQHRLSRAGIPFETQLDGQDIVVALYPSIAEALSIGINRDAPDELFFALVGAFPELRRSPDALRERIRALELEYSRLQRIAS